jgi:hypothetical protein
MYYFVLATVVQQITKLIQGNKFLAYMYAFRLAMERQVTNGVARIFFLFPEGKIVLQVFPCAALFKYVFNITVLLKEYKCSPYAGIIAHIFLPITFQAKYIFSITLC